MPELPSPDINDLSKLNLDSYQIVDYDKNYNRITVRTPWYGYIFHQFTKTTIKNDVLNVITKTIESSSQLLSKLSEQDLQQPTRHLLESKISRNTEALMHIYQAALAGQVEVHIDIKVINQEICKLALLQEKKHLEQTATLYQRIKEELKKTGLQSEQIDKSDLLFLIFTFVKAISEHDLSSIYILKKNILATADELLKIPSEKYQMTLLSTAIDRSLESFIKENVK